MPFAADVENVFRTGSTIYTVLWSGPVEIRRFTYRESGFMYMRFGSNKLTGYTLCNRIVYIFVENSKCKSSF